MKREIVRFLALSLFAGSCCMSTTALAYEPNPETLGAKGYSPIIMETIKTQKDRQEWRNPAPPAMTPKDRFYHNIFYNNWTGSMDAFGSQIIREQQ